MHGLGPRIKALMMSDDGEDLILQQLNKDADHFSSLLDLIPPQNFFNNEERDEIWGNDSTEDRKHKKGKLSQFTVSQIADLRQKGLPLGGKLKNKHSKQTSDHSEEESQTASKHEGKKHSRNNKNKQKAKELQRRNARLEELKQRLQAKVEEMKARKSAGQTVTSQEKKKLKRQQKKVNAKLKNKVKNKTNKGVDVNNKLAEGLRSPPQNKILNSNGQPVKSKFDFSVISFGNDRAKSSELTGRDYRRLLEKVERRKEKVEKLKEKDAEAGKKLETKIQWQTVMSKAQGEKVKDDPHLLNKAAKRKDKVKDRVKKKWADRAKTIKEAQKKKSDRREANLEKRKTDKKDKKRKKLIKKGRIIPGF